MTRRRGREAPPIGWAFAAAAIGGVLVAACGQSPATKAQPFHAGTRAPAALSLALSAEGVPRGKALADVAALVSAIGILDQADAAAVAGDATSVRSVRRAGSAPLAAAAAQSPALRAARLTAYRGAVDTLAATPAESVGVGNLQRTAIAAARNELDALGSFDAVADSAWVTFRGLADAQATWLTRVDGGWYQSTQQSGDAYTVLTDGPRSVVAANRSALATASAALQASSLRASAALRALAAALGAVTH